MLLKKFSILCLCLNLGTYFIEAHAEHNVDVPSKQLTPLQGTTNATCTATTTKLYGYVEKVVLVDQNLTLSAKLDTGAKTASLNANNVHEIEKNGKTYMRFKVLDKEQAVEFTAEYIGKVSIKPRADEPLSTIKRPLVMMRVQIGDKIRTIPVNLTNRQHFNYPLLLGRDAIVAFGGIIDPSRAFVVKPSTPNGTHERS